MRKAIAITLMSMLVVICVCTVPVQAVTLDFEGIGSYVPIPNGYGMLNWQNFWVVDPVREGLVPSGYVNGIVSGTHVAYNAFADPASILQTTSPIVLHSTYLTGAWNNGLSIRADGYLGGILKYTKTVTVSAFDHTLVSYEFINVDRVQWTSWGGVNAGFGGSGTHFAMDDLSYDAVPEPSSLLALAIGAGGLIGRFSFRSKKSKGGIQ